MSIWQTSFNDGHMHAAVLDSMGCGRSNEGVDGHVHDVYDFIVLPSEDGHTHTLELELSPAP
jgi:hypothetical protein